MAATIKFDSVLPVIHYTGSKVILEYVFVNIYGKLLSKVKVTDTEPLSVDDCPRWDNYMPENKEGTIFHENFLKPIAMFENPFYQSPHKIVLCEAWLTKDKPTAYNTRHSCRKTMERLKYDTKTGHRPKQPHDPWFGIEQEYFIIDDEELPVSYNPDNYNYSNLILYTAAEHPHAKNIGIERELQDRHLMACLYAGVKIGGYNRENGPSQWEFQIGPCLEESIGDHLYVARYILVRLAEMFGVRVTFHPVPVPGTALASGGHINISTSRMREKGGIKFIKHAIDILSKSDQELLLQMYDPTPNLDNKERLSNVFSNWHPLLDEFIQGVADKVSTSVRIPAEVSLNGCGYFEDRRPSANIDPYVAAEGLVRACIFGDFLRPEFEALKDMTIWDQNCSEDER